MKDNSEVNEMSMFARRQPQLIESSPLKIPTEFTATIVEPAFVGSRQAHDSTESSLLATYLACELVV